MLRFLIAAVVYPAARYYSNVGVFSDNEIVVYKVVKSGFAYNDRNMDNLVFCAGLYDYIDTRIICFGLYIYIFRNMPVGMLTVLSDIVSALRFAVHIRYYL